MAATAVAERGAAGLAAAATAAAETGVAATAAAGLAAAATLAAETGVAAAEDAERSRCQRSAAGRAASGCCRRTS